MSYYLRERIKFYQNKKNMTTTVIGQKDKSQNGRYKKTNTPKFPKNKHFLPPDTHTHVGTKYSFFGKFGVLLFPYNTRFEIRTFALLPTKNISKKPTKNKTTETSYKDLTHYTLYIRINL